MNKLTGSEIKKKLLFIIASKRIKYLGVELRKVVQNLYSENCITLLKEIKEHLIKWKDIPCTSIGRLNIVKMAVLLRLTYRFNAIAIKIPADLCRN